MAAVDDDCTSQEKSAVPSRVGLGGCNKQTQNGTTNSVPPPPAQSQQQQQTPPDSGSPQSDDKLGCIEQRPKSDHLSGDFCKTNGCNDLNSVGDVNGLKVGEVSPPSISASGDHQLLSTPTEPPKVKTDEAHDTSKLSKSLVDECNGVLSDSEVESQEAPISSDPPKPLVSSKETSAVIVIPDGLQFSPLVQADVSSSESSKEAEHVPIERCDSTPCLDAGTSDQPVASSCTNGEQDNSVSAHDLDDLELLENDCSAVRAPTDSAVAREEENGDSLLCEPMDIQKDVSTNKSAKEGTSEAEVGSGSTKGDALDHDVELLEDDCTASDPPKDSAIVCEEENGDSLLCESTDEPKDVLMDQSPKEGTSEAEVCPGSTKGDVLDHDLELLEDDCTAPGPPTDSAVAREEENGNSLLCEPMDVQKDVPRSQSPKEGSTKTEADSGSTKADALDRDLELLEDDCTPSAPPTDSAVVCEEENGDSLLCEPMDVSKNVSVDQSPKEGSSEAQAGSSGSTTAGTSKTDTLDGVDIAENNCTAAGPPTDSAVVVVCEEKDRDSLLSEPMDVTTKDDGDSIGLMITEAHTLAQAELEGDVPVNELKEETEQKVTVEEPSKTSVYEKEMGVEVPEPPRQSVIRVEETEKTILQDSQDASVEIKETDSIPGPEEKAHENALSGSEQITDKQVAQSKVSAQGKQTEAVKTADIDDVIVIEDECVGSEEAGKSKSSFKDVLKTPCKVFRPESQPSKSDDSSETPNIQKLDEKPVSSKGDESTKPPVVAAIPDTEQSAGLPRHDVKADEKDRKRPLDNPEAEGSPKRSRLVDQRPELPDGEKKADSTTMPTKAGSSQDAAKPVELEDDDIIVEKIVKNSDMNVQVSSQTLQTFVNACVRGFLRSRKQDNLDRLNKLAQAWKGAETLWSETAKHLQKSVDELSAQRQKLNKQKAKLDGKNVSSRTIGVQVGDGPANLAIALKSPPLTMMASASPSARLSLPQSARLNPQYQAPQPIPQPVQTSYHSRQVPPMRPRGGESYPRIRQPATSAVLTHSPHPNHVLPPRQPVQFRHQPHHPPSPAVQGRKPVGNLIDLTDDEDIVSRKAAAPPTKSPNHHQGPSSNGRAALGNGSNSLAGNTANGYVQPGLRAGSQGSRVINSQVGQTGVRAPAVTTTTTTNNNRLIHGGVSRPPTAGAPSLGTGAALTLAPSVLIHKHPASLPNPPKPTEVPATAKRAPPKPGLKISKAAQGIVLSWNMPCLDGVEVISSYQLFAYQETNTALPSSHLWKKVGDVKALPLPMACTLTQFQEGNKYHFAVRAVDRFGRCGFFSDPSTIFLEPK